MRYTNRRLLYFTLSYRITVTVMLLQLSKKVKRIRKNSLCCHSGA